MALVDDNDVEGFLDEHSGWSRSGDSISRTFEFEDFNEAMGFVIRVSLEAEKADHHPDIDIRWNKVTLVLSTHSEGGLTAKDLEMAETADGLV